MSTLRPVRRVLQAQTQREGGGFTVRRPFPVGGLIQLDPFLLLDEMGPVEYAPGEAVGAPDHPHRGFETVTYFLEGGGEHGTPPGTAASCARRCAVDDRRLGGDPFRAPGQGRSSNRAAGCTVSRSGVNLPGATR
jgi:hypothetical protein